MESDFYTVYGSKSDTSFFKCYVLKCSVPEFSVTFTSLWIGASAKTNMKDSINGGQWRDNEVLKFQKYVG